MTRECICSYEQSIRLKRLGFDWACWCLYKKLSYRELLDRCNQADNFNAGMYVSAPTHEVAHKWLRDVMHLSITVNPQKDPDGNPGYNFSVFYLEDLSPVGWSYEIYGNYESAMSAALDYAIECAIIQFRKRTVSR